VKAERKLGAAGKFAQAWINSKLTPLVIGGSLLLGGFAVWKLPREEEPQIIVPMVDVFVQMPGASAREVEERVTKPMEKLLWEIPGVEYIYSTSSPGMSTAIVRFLVGQDEEKAIVRPNQKMAANLDLIPPGASQPLVKPRSIDDVPILALTFWSKRYGDFELRRVAAQVDDAIKQTPDVSAVALIGGQRREIRITLNQARLAAYNLSPARAVIPGNLIAILGWLCGVAKPAPSFARIPSVSASIPRAVLLLVGLDVIESESLQRRTGQAELRGLLRCAIVIPLVDQHAFDQPHGRGAVSTGAMNERWLSAGFGDGFDKLVGDRGVRHSSIERKMHEVDASSLGCRRFSVDVGSRFIRQPQIDDGCESHLLDTGYRCRRYRARACDGCLHLSEVGNPRHSGFLDLGLSDDNRSSNRNDGKNQ
jgi:hypothetical protein